MDDFTCPSCGHDLRDHGGNRSTGAAWCCDLTSSCNCTVRRWEHGVTRDDVARYQGTASAG